MTLDSLRKDYKEAGMDIRILCQKYRDVIPYLFFGVCTTLVNIIVYWLMAYPFNCSTMLSTVVAWVVSVLFAYVTNRKWVFHSSANGAKEIFKEIGSFFSCRLATGFVDLGCMWVFVDILNFNDVIIKILSNVLVIILNYVASKLFIFRKTNKNTER